MDRSTARLVTVTALFAALTLLFTYPVWTAPQRLLNDIFDARLTSWIMAWDAHALLDPGDALFDANIFYPYGDTLAFSENLLGSALLVAPLNWAGAPILAYNVLLLLSFVLSGLAMVLWVRRLRGGWIAGIVAGLVWTFAPTKTDHLAHIQLLTSMWVPLALWILTIYVQERRRGLLLVAAGLLGWQYWSGIQAALVTLPLVALYFLAAWFHRTEPRSGEARALCVETILAAMLLAVMVVPVSLPYLQVSDAHGFVRDMDEIRAFSARPSGYLAGSWTNRTPHMAALHRQLGKPEGNHGLGILASTLLVLVVGATLRRVVHYARRPHSDDGDGVEFRRTARRAAFTTALVVTGLATALHLSGSLTAALDFARRGGLAALPAAACRILHPAIWIAAGATVVVLTWREERRADRRTTVYLLLLWPAALGYLLSLGPVVESTGVALGGGPFALAHDWILPYRSMRAVGRFGLAWLLFAAPLVGLATDRLLAASPRGHRARWLRPALAALLMTGIVWEFRTWPLAATDATIPEPEVYRALAELPGDGAVLDLPLQPRGDPPRASEYMLGSTLHWRPLVTGYSGFAPHDTARLFGMSPGSDEFWELVHRDFPVDHVIVHGRWFQRTEYEATVRQLRRRRDLRLVAEHADATIFAVQRTVERATVVHRRFAARELRPATGLAFDVRGLEPHGEPPVEPAVRVLWADTLAGECPVGQSWSRCRLPAPAGWEPRADGTATIRVWRPPAPEFRAPLASTGATLDADLLVDAQLHHLAFARDDVWQHGRAEPGVMVAVLDLGGRRLREVREFAAAPAAAEALRRFVAGLPDGLIVGVAVHRLAPPDPNSDTTAPIAAALRLVGASGEIPEGTWVHAVLGVRGAPPGTALEGHSPNRAAVRAGPTDYPGDTIAVRDLRPRR